MFSRVLSCCLRLLFPNHLPCSPLLSSPPSLPLSNSIFAWFFFIVLLKKQKNNKIYCSREDSCKLAPTFSLSFPCHNGVSKDKLLQLANRTKQKMQHPSISSSNNLCLNILGSNELCQNKLCPSLQINNEKIVKMWKSVWTCFTFLKCAKH
jgi:hypothetical protein